MNTIPTGFDWLMIIASLISVKAILLIRLIPLHYIALLMYKISKKKTTKLEKDEETDNLCNI